MNQIAFVNVSRRDFLRTGAAFSLAVTLSPMAFAAGAEGGSMPPPPLPDPLGFLRIGKDNTVTVISKHLEMGQGIYTGLATLVAEELGASWEQIRVEPAPADLRRYANVLMGAMGTGGQTGSQSSYIIYRQAGAAARAMLVAAAAEQWKVPVASVVVDSGMLRTTAGTQSATFGAMAEAAAKQKVPTDVNLKDAKDFVFIGKRFPRVDSRAKVTGAAKFPLDVKLPGMRVAVVARPTRVGVKLKTFDASAAMKVRGVVKVLAVPSGVAVVAEDFWAAKKGRDALKISWDESGAFQLSSADILKDLRAAAQAPAKVAAARGDVDGSFAKAAKTVAYAFDIPYLAHATMEPMNCVVQLGKDSCEVWGGTQMQLLDQPALAKELGLKLEQVKLNMTYVGGSFGRRAQPHSQAHLEAVRIAKLLDDGRPLKVMWTREEDMASAQSYYRPAYAHRIEVGLDDKGNVVAWRHQVAGQSILRGMPMEVKMRDGVDFFSVEGGIDQPYDIANFSMRLAMPEYPILTSWLRTSGTFHNGFAVESTIDQIAQDSKRDPVEFRRGMLAKSPRALAALNLAADKAGWARALAPGKAGERRGRGVAVTPSHRSFAASVVEVTITAKNEIVVDRVVTALDCGTAINPDNILSQIEGATAWALSSCLYNEITFVKGRVKERNFDTYPVVRMHQMPRVEGYIVPSEAIPNGAGETPMASVAPALANAIYSATGKRLTTLPLKLV